MKSRLLAFPIALVVLAGCAGSGATAQDVSPFEGQWVGTWTSPTLNQNGTSDVMIDAEGNITGTVYNEDIDATAQISGVISEDGEITGTGQFPFGSPLTLTGTWSFIGANQIGGDLTQTVGSTTHTLSFVSTLQPN